MKIDIAERWLGIYVDDTGKWDTCNEINTAGALIWAELVSIQTVSHTMYHYLISYFDNDNKLQKDIIAAWNKPMTIEKLSEIYQRIIDGDPEDDDCWIIPEIEYNDDAYMNDMCDDDECYIFKYKWYIKYDGFSIQLSDFWLFDCDFIIPSYTYHIFDHRFNSNVLYSRSYLISTLTPIMEKDCPDIINQITILRGE
jgi:hypothetical protein